MIITNNIKFSLLQKLFFAIFLALLIATVLIRIHFGVDLSDEAYYAAFLDDWLKQGMRGSHNLMLHQTAAFLVFPFAYIYKFIKGDVSGLILYLRYLYVFLSLGSMLCLFFLIKKINSSAVALLALAFGFFFIPFSLPAPSYNTLGMCGFIAATTLFALGYLNHANYSNKWGFFSALFWGTSVVAYPSLLLSFLFFSALCYFFLGIRNRSLCHYVICFSSIMVCAALLLVISFGTAHLINTLEFSDALLKVSDGFSRKITMTIHFFDNNLSLAFLSLCVFIAGIFIAFFPNNFKLKVAVTIFIIGSIFYLASKSPVLFLQSHDIILFLSLFGIYIPITYIRTKKHEKKLSLLNVLYCTSIFSGILTAFTASNALYNFPIGGSLAAILSLSSYINKNERKLLQYFHLAAMLSAILCFGLIFFKFMYGEGYGNPLKVTPEKMTTGIFSGLITSQKQAVLINKIMTILPQSENNKGKILVLGSLPGVYLLTSLNSVGLTTWTDVIVTNSAAANFMALSLSYPENKPDIIVRQISSYSSLTPAEKLLLLEYKKVTNIKVGYIELALYEKSQK